MKKALIASLAALPLATAGAFSFAGSADAISLQLSTGSGGSQTIHDGAANDSIGLSNAVGFAGGIGNFIIDITTGFSKPFAGTVELPGLNLNSQNSNILADTLTVKLSETGFSNAASAMDWFLSISGNAEKFIGGLPYGGDADVSYSLYADGSNALFGTGSVLLASTGIFNTNYAANFSGAYDSSLLDGSPFSVTLVMNVAQAANSTTQLGATLSSVAKESVPEPATLMGLGVVGAALSATRRRKSAES